MDLSGGIDIQADWATYDQRHLPGWSGAQPGRDELWFRTPFQEVIRYAGPGAGAVKQTRHALNGGNGPKLVIVDRPWDEGQRLLTITMLNDGQSGSTDDIDCYFQCALRIRPGRGRADPALSRTP